MYDDNLKGKFQTKNSINSICSYRMRRHECWKKFVYGHFQKCPLPTIAVELKTKLIHLKDGSIVKAQIWDTAGMEKYKSVTCHHYKKAHGALLVYDVTNRNSFLNIKRWLKELLENTDLKCVVFMVGNKIDLIKENYKNREVTFEEGNYFALENNLNFYETSALSNFNISEVFQELMERIKDNKVNLKLSDIKDNNDSDNMSYVSNLRKKENNNNTTNQKDSCCSLY